MMTFFSRVKNVALLLLGFPENCAERALFFTAAESSQFLNLFTFYATSEGKMAVRA